MKAKTFILTFLMMFCSYAFGQAQNPWGSVDGNAQENNMNVIAQIYIDNDMLGNNYEIGAFCGNEFRGSARPNDSQFKLVFLTIYGKSGDKISYKLYDHSRGQELDYFITDAET
ncbi:MAG: hypothetical protein IIV21_02115, partial [Bacteroidales bacterium]|nr:hypothetical protein [Bacteroidales bacterium]